MCISPVDFPSGKLPCIEQSCLVEVYARESLSACRQSPTRIQLFGRGYSSGRKRRMKSEHCSGHVP